MDFQRLDEIARKAMLDRRTHKERENGFVYHHGARVSKLVINLRKLITDDDSHDALLACAGLFHDVGKRIGEHGESGAFITRYLLAKELNEDEMNEVARLISLHNKRGTGVDLWAKLIQDADILDHYGTQQLWINFHYYANTEGSVMDSVAFYEGEFQKEHKKIRELINFEISARIYDEKYAFVMDVARRMRTEGEGGIEWIPQLDKSARAAERMPLKSEP